MIEYHFDCMRLRSGLASITLFFSMTTWLIGADARFNEVQVIGTHNSYHIAPDESLMRVIEKTNPEGAKSLQYSRRPLTEQFSAGIRQIELDLFADPRGGLFAEPKGNKIATEQGLPIGPNQDPTGALRKPGFKVLHIPDFDFRSTVLTLLDGLTQIRDWSEAHPGHFPIFVLLELKDEAAGPEFTQPVPFGLRELETIDAEILSVFKREEILKPDDVRGKFATLPEALKKQGWPTLDAVRGKVLFALDNEDATRDLYLKDHPALQGRIMFVSAKESDPAAAWMKRNDPVAQFEQIQKLVKAGFIVRTRADADTAEARRNDTSRREKAFASGAQFISTDYPQPDLRLSNYQVRFEGGVVVRTNPVNGDSRLNGRDLEKPALSQ